jgi:hypothetical protein
MLSGSSQPNHLNHLEESLLEEALLRSAKHGATMTQVCSESYEALGITRLKALRLCQSSSQFTCSPDCPRHKKEKAPQPPAAHLAARAGPGLAGVLYLGVESHVWWAHKLDAGLADRLQIGAGCWPTAGLCTGLLGVIVALIIL